MRVLAIDQDPSVRQSVTFTLNRAGFVTDFAGTARDGLELARSRRHALVLLELDLLDIPGEELLCTLRRMGIGTPTLILSKFKEAEIKVRAFRAGADDYLTKPFHPLELIARIQAILRRSGSPCNHMIKVGQLTINLDAQSIEVEGKAVHVTEMEYQVLELLALRKGRTLSKPTLQRHLYQERDVPRPKMIDLFVCNLRKKLAKISEGESYIQTVWGRGYRLDEPLPPESHPEGEAKVLGTARPIPMTPV